MDLHNSCSNSYKNCALGCLSGFFSFPVTVESFLARKHLGPIVPKRLTRLLVLIGSEA